MRAFAGLWSKGRFHGPDAPRDVLTCGLADMRKIDQAISDSDETALLLRSGEASLARVQVALK